VFSASADLKMIVQRSRRGCRCPIARSLSGE
jgi:hypothetical protein